VRETEAPAEPLRVERAPRISPVLSADPVVLVTDE
jgi:hypothetical protein